MIRTRRSRAGQGLAEYGLIMGLVAVMSIGVLSVTGTSVSSLINTIATAVGIASSDSGSSGSGSGGFGQFSSNFNGFGFSLNGDGSVSIGHTGFARSNDNVISGPGGTPTTLSLQISGGSPPAYIAVDSPTAGFNAFYTGTSDGAGNATYALQPSPFKPSTTLATGDKVAVFLHNSSGASTTVAGFQLGY